MADTMGPLLRHVVVTGTLCLFVVDVQCNEGHGYQLSSLCVDTRWLDTEDGCFIQ